MSNLEQTYNWVGGEKYGTGTRAKGSASTTDLQSAFGDPGFNEAYGVPASVADGYSGAALCAVYETNVLRVLNGENGQFAIEVDLTFGQLTSETDLIPPVITATTIGDVTMDGSGGDPVGGFGPNVASPIDGSTLPGDMPAMEGYAESLGRTGTNGSNQSPGDVDIGNADTIIHHLPAYRPGRTEDDPSNGAV